MILLLTLKDIGLNILANTWNFDYTLNFGRLKDVWIIFLKPNAELTWGPMPIRFTVLLQHGLVSWIEDMYLCTYLKISGQRKCVTELSTLLRSAKNIPHEVQFLTDAALQIEWVRQLTLIQWLTISNLWKLWCLVYLIHVLEQKKQKTNKKTKKKGSDWSVWTMDKPHLAPTGTGKPAGGGLVLVDCLQTTCWRKKKNHSTQWADAAKFKAREHVLRIHENGSRRLE